MYIFKINWANWPRDFVSKFLNNKLLKKKETEAKRNRKAVKWNWNQTSRDLSEVKSLSKGTSLKSSSLPWENENDT